jgi:hypothetical protein
MCLLLLELFIKEKSKDTMWRDLTGKTGENEGQQHTMGVGGGHTHSESEHFSIISKEDPQMNSNADIENNEKQIISSFGAKPS